MFDLIQVRNSKTIREKAKELGFDEIFSVEEFGKETEAEGVLIRAKTKEDLINKINRAKGRYRFVIVLGGNNEINRTALESKHADMLLNPEQEREKDFMKYRDSGLNHVLCKIAKENGKAIGIDFSQIRKMKGKEDAERLGRVLQNIRLCRKYDVRLVLASLAKNEKEMVHSAELKAFARTLRIDRINEL